MSKKPELAVFGGSFNPPHVAHVLAVSWVLSATRVDSVVVVPTFQHPFAKPTASFAHRFAMCELAMAHLLGVRVSRIEEELGGESLTLRTLEELARREPDVQLRLVIGADLVLEAPRWHAFDRIVEIAPLIVIGREGHRIDADVSITLPEVSSTEVRRRIREGEDASGLLPARVNDYVLARGLYKSTAEGT